MLFGRVYEHAGLRFEGLPKARQREGIGEGEPQVGAHGGSIYQHLSAGARQRIVAGCSCAAGRPACHKGGAGNAKSAQ
ncbi:hypothetical protein GCM10023184_25180 [Flaviaesturariibacter amylovorans]|uniref:Uncharacterized protein n=1 Tax=Flaviaesturariibacter amylovorans TaxID=1084520 RepID=A0ABP8H178_9BACT